MLAEYVRAAMHKATYEILPDGTFHGEIPGFQEAHHERSRGFVALCKHKRYNTEEVWP